MVALCLDLLRGAWESVRETLPSTEDEGGAFLAGMVWAFVLFWLAVLVGSWLTAKAHGWPL